MRDEYETEEIEQLIDKHREKFLNYWGLNDNEEKLVEDFSESLKRLFNGEMQKQAMKKVIDDMIEADEGEE